MSNSCWEKDFICFIVFYFFCKVFHNTAATAERCWNAICFPYMWPSKHCPLYPVFCSTVHCGIKALSQLSSVSLPRRVFRCLLNYERHISYIMNARKSAAVQDVPSSECTFLLIYADSSLCFQLAALPLKRNNQSLQYEWFKKKKR